MKHRLGAIVMAVLLVIYLAIVVQRSFLLFESGNGVGVVMGAALIILPLIAAWAIVREVLFGVRTERLVRILDAEGNLPVEELPHRASGRPLREAADAEFPKYRAEVEAEPQSWRAWFRLGLAYDASGDRRRARHALREAIRLYRASEPAAG
jgi:hypothetical protein